MIEETYVGQELEIRFSHRYFSSLRIFFFFHSLLRSSFLTK